MCDLLTYAMPEEAAEPIQSFLIESLGERIYVTPFVNEGSGHAYEAKLKEFSITNGHCSCGLVYEGSPKKDQERALERKIANYRKRGWSDTKIDRAIADHTRTSRKPRFGKTPILEDIAKFLEAEHRRCGYLEFISHFHSGLFSREQFATQTVSVASISDIQNSEFHRDTRYVLKENDA